MDGRYHCGSCSPVCCLPTPFCPAQAGGRSTRRRGSAQWRRSTSSSQREQRWTRRARARALFLRSRLALAFCARLLHPLPLTVTRRQELRRVDCAPPRGAERTHGGCRGASAGRCLLLRRIHSVVWLTMPFIQSTGGRKVTKGHFLTSYRARLPCHCRGGPGERDGGRAESGGLRAPIRFSAAHGDSVHPRRTPLPPSSCYYYYVANGWRSRRRRNSSMQQQQLVAAAGSWRRNANAAAPPPPHRHPAKPPGIASFSGPAAELCPCCRSYRRGDRRRRALLRPPGPRTRRQHRTLQP